MWRIYKPDKFHSAHFIKDHPTCGFTHGHSYQLIVKVEGDPKEFLDFHDIKDAVDLVIKDFDHKDLGDCTCEKLAQTILYRLQGSLSALRHVRDVSIGTISIELWETDHFGVEM